MGTCLSRCASSSQEEECDNVQDKLVISQSPSLPTLPLSKDISTKQTTTPSPSSSFSITPTTTNTTIVTTSSSSSVSTDGSFANDFSRPRLDESTCSSPISHPIKERTLKPKKPVKFPTSSPKEQPRKVIMATPKQSLPRQCTHYQTPKKARSSSPSLARRRTGGSEHEKHSSVPLPRRNLRSESPCRRSKEDSFRGQNPKKENLKHEVTSRGRSPYSSQRFNGGGTCSDLLGSPPKEACKRNIVCRGRSPSPRQRFNKDAHRGPLRDQPEKKNKNGNGSAGNRGAPTRKENTRPMNPSNFKSNGNCLQKGEVGIHHSTDPPVDQCTRGEVISKMEDSSTLPLPMEQDRDNPLISLDCFIFL